MSTSVSTVQISDILAYIYCPDCNIYNIVDTDTWDNHCNRCGERYNIKYLNGKSRFVMSALQSENEKLKGKIFSLEDRILKLEAKFVSQQ